MLVHDPEKQELNAVLYNHSTFGADEEIGRVSVPLRQLRPGETEDLWLELGPPAGSKHANPLGAGIRASHPCYSVCHPCQSLRDISITFRGLALAHTQHGWRDSAEVIEDSRDSSHAKLDAPLHPCAGIDLKHKRLCSWGIKMDEQSLSSRSEVPHCAVKGCCLSDLHVSCVLLPDCDTW